MVSRADVQRSDALDTGVRVGLVAYGVVHLLVAYTALRLALGDGGGKADQDGALSQLARQPGGELGLWLLALGFLALVVWQGFEAALGHADEDGVKKVGKRIGSAGRAVVFLVLGLSAVQKASGSSSGSSGTDSTTAKVMSAPGGQVLVLVVGLGIVAVGCFLVWTGVSERFTDHLDGRATSGSRRTPIVWLGTVGYVAKGVALAAVGVLFTTAAVQFEPKKSGGLDQALKAVLDEPFGPWLLTGVALGIGCYGLFCLAWARHLDR